MRIKKYLLQFELAESTRWLIEPGQELPVLKLIGENLAASFTAGPRPAVTVTKEEEREPDPITLTELP